MVNRRWLSSVVALLIFVVVGLSGCVLVGQTRSYEDNVLFVSTTSEVRAKFVVIDELSSVAVIKGLTPDTVALSGTRVARVKAKYRVDIIHPDTGEVYSAKVEGKRTLLGWGIDPTEVKAPF